ncbi:hypothetical protein, variant [Fonticula alba]|nr:hypothetical protein, variant [Fonticula alba]KCV72438.1 hypothetical protein, variant [Fonticula alba]|eukprot:XP_009492139.1 hypothetical protein, variant [Fonticula alba]
MTESPIPPSVGPPTTSKRPKRVPCRKDMMFIRAFEMWYKHEYEADPEGGAKIGQFFEDLQERMPIEGTPRMVLLRTYELLEDVLQSTGCRSDLCHLRWSAWGEACLELKAEASGPKPPEGERARPVIVLNPESRRMDFLDEEQVVLQLRSASDAPGGPLMTPFTGLDDRWDWAESESPPPSFRPVRAWRVCEMLAKVEVCRSHQEGVDTTRWSVWEKREDPMSLAIRVREAVLHCLSRSPSERQMKEIFESITLNVLWDWSLEGSRRSSAWAESLGSVPQAYRVVLIGQLFHSLCRYATLGEQVFMTYHAMSELGFGFGWKDACYLALLTSRGVGTDRHTSVKRVLSIIASDRPRNPSFLAKEGLTLARRIEPGQVLWPAQWDGLSGKYRLYFELRKHARANETNVQAPPKRRKVRPPPPRRFSERPSED